MFRTHRASPSARCIEALESRTLLSASPAVVKPLTSATTLTLTAKTAKLGQAVTAKITVKDSKRGVKPTGSVELLDNGVVIDGLSTPLTLSLNSRGQASYTFGPGNVAFYTGTHVITAQYLGDGTSPTSTSRAGSLVVSSPKFVTASDGVGVATIKKGRAGRIAATGNTAVVSYTGFLTANGTIFDFASGHGTGSSTFAFTLNTSPEEVIPGFDQGVTGMKVGETRAISIPSAQGYGAQANGSIPANSDLLFLITLQAVA